MVSWCVPWNSNRSIWISFLTIVFGLNCCGLTVDAQEVRHWTWKQVSKGHWAPIRLEQQQNMAILSVLLHFPTRSRSHLRRLTMGSVPDRPRPRPRRPAHFLPHRHVPVSSLHLQRSWWTQRASKTPRANEVATADDPLQDEQGGLRSWWSWHCNLQW